MTAAELSARWEVVVSSVRARVLPALEPFEALRRVPFKPRAARRFLRHLVRPPTRGYWTRRACR